MELTSRDRALLTVIAALLIAFFALQVAAATLDALARVADVLLVFLAAWVVAYLLAPLVETVDRRTPLGRLGAVGVVYLVILVVLAAVAAIGVPTIAGQLAALGALAPELGRRAAQMVVDIEQGLAAAGVAVDLEGFYGQLPGRLGDLTGEFATDALAIVAATGALLFNMTLVLIIAFFMLVDGDRLWDRFLGLLSDELRSEAQLLRQSADRSFGGFIRASLVLGLIYGTATFLILAPLGVPLAGLLAVVAGLTMIIPFFGPFIAMVPVLAVTGFAAPDRFLPVLALTLALQQVTLNVIGPRLMGNVIGIHPLFVFLALLLGAKIAGFWGVLLAMPIAGIANTFLRYVYEVTQGRRTRVEAEQLILDAHAAAEPPPEITVARR